jgi:glyoxylase-like metal-dependent hydrolase (beta-lactamase superfamily II)
MPDDFDPPVGKPEEIAPMLRRIVAPNPSAMTYRGTNTYLLGQDRIAVIDPGPLSETHLAAIVDALRPGQSISHIIVTHSHLDHSPLSGPLAEVSGAPVLAFGNAQAGRSDIMWRLATEGLTSGGEGVDRNFEPDQTVADGAQISTPEWQLTVRHTPGHLGNHICLEWGNSCFTGDHVMGWASSLVSPPDGDLTDFMASCLRLMRKDWQVFYPGHGDLISAPNQRLDWLLNHRKGREKAILSILDQAPCDIRSLTEAVYHDTPKTLLPAAERNVLAHLIDLYRQSKIKPTGAFDLEGVFHRVRM